MPASGKMSARGDMPAAAPQRVHLRPDPALWRVGVAVIALALAAVNYESNTAWLLACLVGALTVVSGLHTWRNLRGVEIEPLAVTPVFAGQAIALRVQVQNLVQPGYALTLHLGDTQTQIPALATAVPVQVTLHMPPLPRGLHRLTGVECLSSYPFGVMRARIRPTAAVEVLVFPAALGRPLDPAAGTGEGDGPAHGDGDDFAGHRAWQVGDNQRRVDWRAVARGRPLLIKHFHGGVSACLLDWQTTAGDRETRLRQLTRWIIDAEAQGWRYGLRLPGVDIPSGAGVAHRLLCLRTLALYPRAETEPLVARAETAPPTPVGAS